MSPYIKKTDREIIKITGKPHTCGELNYVLTKTLLDYLPSDPHYSEYNEIIGVLECCKLEMYRRKIALMEDKKIEENGDVY